MNSLEKLFSELNKLKINYCVIRKYQELPLKIKGDVDLMIDKEYLQQTLEKLKNLGFVYYPHTGPHYFFFKYDSEIGLIKIDLVIGKLPKLKKFKNFFVPVEDGEKIRIKKSFFMRIYTRMKRTLHWLGRGKLICFVGPDGCGKSYLSKKTYEALREYPLKKELIYFGTKKSGKIYRILDLVFKLIKVRMNLLLGRVTITDRYVYLTFRKKTFLNKLIRGIYPKPSLGYLVKVNPDIILKRKDELTREQIVELYRHYDKVKELKHLDNSYKNSSEVTSRVVNEILAI